MSVEYKDVADADFISFDLWDTLLLRPFAKPSHLFTYVGGRDYFCKRIASERTARIGKEEICDSDIDGFNPNERVCENLLARPNFGMLALLRRLYDEGKRVCIISDFYSKIRFSDFGRIPIYYSCEYGASKRTGRLFKILKDKLKINGKWIHIDDNSQNCAAARACGINAIKIESGRNLLYAKYPRLRNLGEFTLPLSIWFGLCANRNLNYPNEDFWVRFGYMFAPVVIAYAEWIYKRAKLDDVERLLFVLRDGYFVKQAFDELYPLSLETKLIAASRAMLGSGDKNSKIYFDDLQQSKKKTAIVDGATFRYSAYKVANQPYSLSKPLYYVWFEKISAKFPKDENIPCFSFSPYNDFNNFKFKDFDLIELLLAAPMLPICGIDDKGNFKHIDSAQEEARIDIIRKIGQGIIEHCQDYRALKPVYDFDTVLRILNNFYSDPSDEERENIANIQHSPSSGHKNFRCIKIK